MIQCDAAGCDMSVKVLSKALSLVVVMAPRCAKHIDHDGNSDGCKTDWVPKEAGRFALLVVIRKRSMAFR